MSIYIVEVFYLSEFCPTTVSGTHFVETFTAYVFSVCCFFRFFTSPFSPVDNTYSYRLVISLSMQTDFIYCFLGSVSTYSMLFFHFVDV